MEPENSQDLGENRTVFTIKHSDIKATGKKMCYPEDHHWKKLSENEIYCMNCPTVLVVQLDDPRLVKMV